ncbi:MAG: HAD family hydrolase [Desulfobulbaceae bacterium]|nr:MAG: HAD family hydrolase [Desulfobulbaceae bacterium]
MKTLLFDLDGTLTDPSRGILNCIEYSLEKLAVQPVSREVLYGCIGPPLRRVFAELLTTGDQSLIEEGVRLYRERFSESGLFENELYPGIENLLENFNTHGYTLFVATSKPEVYARRILDHFEIMHYFEALYGPDLKGRLEDKRLLVKKLLADHNCRIDRTCMIGDRKYDIEAGRFNNIKTCGVTYGFGSLAELEDCGSDLICHGVDQLFEVIGKLF